MIGQQTIELNEATLTEAIQEYLNRHLVKPVTVTGIKVDSGQYNGLTIEAKIEEQPAAGAK